MNYNCSNFLDLRNLQEQVKTAFCYHFWFQKDFVNMASVGSGCDDMPPYVSIQNFTDDWGSELVSFIFKNKNQQNRNLN